jgi:hypothetical protein
LLFVLWCFILLRKIFSEKVEKNDEQDQKNDHKPIPLVPAFEYRNFIVISIHLHLKIQITNPKKK